MIKHTLLFIAFLCCLSHTFAQSTVKIRELEKKRTELHTQIANSENLLQSTSKGVKSQLENLAVLNTQIAERKKYVQMIEADVRTLGKEVIFLQKKLNVLNKELLDKKKKYEASVQYMYHNKSIQEKLIFIFSAENLAQTYRRMRYVREYADYQRIQAADLEKKQEQVKQKKQELERMQSAKKKLLKTEQEEKQRLEKKEKERKDVLTSLKRKQRDIKREISQKKRSAQRLNAQIDRLIEIEIEKARQREAAARRKKEAEAKAKNKSASAKTKDDSKKSEAPKREVVKEKMESFRMNEADRKLSGSLEQNRGKLPVPITGPYAIIGRYGQYAVDGLRNVRLDNKGIDIKGNTGAKARAVFDGEVSAIFKYNGLNNVLIRHGKYISVYCNLDEVVVSKGAKIHTGDPIGTVHKDASGGAILHFQLRKETVKLNPEQWIRR